MPLWSDNQRLALLKDVKANIFWGFRSYLDFASEHGGIPRGPIVIADKGFTDRFKTVFSVNREWGACGAFVGNPNQKPLDIAPYRPEPSGGHVLELGQDPSDFSTLSDSAGYQEWLEQWPCRSFRPHPKVCRMEETLAEDLARAKLVVGLNTSALVEASVAGVKVEAYGAHSVARGIDRDRPERLRMLRYIEWDRNDPRCAAAIEATLDGSAPAVELPKLVREALPSSPPPRKAQQAFRRKGGTSHPASRARRSRDG